MRMKGFLFAALAAAFAATASASPTGKSNIPPPRESSATKTLKKGDTVKVRGYSYKRQDGKVVVVKPSVRKAPTDKTSTVKVKGYTYRTKDGKIVTVKPHERMAPGAGRGDTDKVKGYTYKTKDGKTVKVKPYTRKSPAK